MAYLVLGFFLVILAVCAWTIFKLSGDLDELMTNPKPEENGKVKCRKCSAETNRVAIGAGTEGFSVDVTPVCIECLMADVKRAIGVSWRVDFVFHRENKQKGKAITIAKKAKSTIEDDYVSS